MEEQGYENNKGTVGGEQQSMEKQYSRDTLERKPGPWDISEEDLPEELKVVPALHFFLYQVVFAIPLVGLIVVIIMSLGATKNKNIRNFARAQLADCHCGGNCSDSIVRSGNSQLFPGICGTLFGSHTHGIKRNINLIHLAIAFRNRELWLFS